MDSSKAKEGAKYLGRKPAFTRAQFAAVRDMLGRGTTSIAQIAKATGVKRPTVYRLKADPAAAEAALAAWGMLTLVRLAPLGQPPLDTAFARQERGVSEWLEPGRSLLSLATRQCSPF
jgi:hypothetical protein